VPRVARRTEENQLRRFGFCRIAGADEVGRGCLAGPVYAAVVVLDPDKHIPGLCDSKLATELARERLYDQILKHAAAWALALAEPAEIDAINIHRASLLAMQRAVSSLVPLPDCVLIDGRFFIPELLLPQRHIVHGDRRCSAIAAASIIAKVTRDRVMQTLHREDPRYGFDRHKGYATADHLAAVARYGYSPQHRRSFRPPTLFDTDMQETVGSEPEADGVR
jgi:ribonuclease HII